MKWTYLILTIFFLLPLQVLAAEPEYVFNQINVSSDMESKTDEYNIGLTCLEGEMEYFDIAGIGQIEAASSGGKNLRVETLDYSSRIFFEEHLARGETQSVYLKVRDIEPKSVDGEMLYYKSFTFPKKVEEFTYTIILPEMIFPDIRSHAEGCTENCTCSDGGPCTCENCMNCLTCEVGTWKSGTTVDPDKVDIENKRLYLIWTKTLAAGERFQVGIIYPERKSYFLLYLAATVIVLGAMFSAGFLKARSKKQGEVAQVFLNEEEKLITDFIKRNGGEVLQKEIWQADSIGFSRTKVTSLITDLEERGIIKREPYKKTFKVILVRY